MDRNINYIRQLKLISHEAETSLLPIRFFESEWKTKTDICKSMLAYKNHDKLIKTIYARKTKVIEVNTINAKQFLDSNHIQGAAISKVNLGLEYNGELASLMTFGKPRYNKTYQWELIRFCTKKYVSVVGGASKLLKHFELVYNPKNLLSYANKRWSEGNLYNKLGFTYLYSTPPSYFYYKLPDMTLYHRTVFQKHMLKDKLESFNSNLTETENMLNNNYRKIYDQGNLVYVKQYKV